MGRYAMKRGIIRDSTYMPCTARYLASVHRLHFGPAMDNDSNHFGSVLYWKQKGAGRLSPYRRVPRHKTAPLRLDRYRSCSLSLAPIPDAFHLSQGWRHLVNACETKDRHGVVCTQTV